MMRVPVRSFGVFTLLIAISCGVWMWPTIAGASLFGAVVACMLFYVVLLHTPLENHVGGRVMFFLAPLGSSLVASGIVMWLLGSIAAAASLIFCLTALLMIYGLLRLGSWRRRRLVKRLEQTLDTGGDIEELLAVVETWTTSEIYQVLLILHARRHYLATERVALALPSHHYALRANWLVAVRLELGDVAGAAEALQIIDGARLEDPTSREIATQTRARVAIAQGRGSEVIAQFGADAVHPDVSSDALPERRMILADAYVSADRGKALAILAQTLDEFGPKPLDRIRSSNRPAASLAAEILSDRAPGPYR